MLLFAAATLEAIAGNLTIRAYKETNGVQNGYSKVLWYDEDTDDYYVSDTPIPSARLFSHSTV